MEFPRRPPPNVRPIWRRPALLLAVVALALYAALLARFMDPYAAGSDTSGYLNHAKLLGAGHLHVAMRALPGLPPDRAPYDIYTPLGLKPAPNGHGLVPTYPSGLPLLILIAARVVGWGRAISLVIGGHAFGGVLLTYALGRRLGLGPAWAALGATAIAVSPLYLLYSVQIMSDVPSMVWIVAAVLAAWQAGEKRKAEGEKGKGCLWAMAAGAALALAVLIRPNSIIAVVPVGIAVGPSWRRWLMLVAGSLPGALLFFVHSEAAYGSVFATGYGDTGYLFSASFIPRTFMHYAHWVPILFTPVALLALGLPGLWRTAPRTVGVLGAWVLVYLAFYSCYRTTHETWWYLRYLLPAAPALLVGGLLVARQWRAGPWGRTAFAVALALIVANGAWWTRNFGVLNTADHDRTYPLTMAWLRDHVPADAVVAAWQASGALFYYTPLALVRWEIINAQGFHRVTAAARAAHLPIYAALFDYERDAALRRHMPGVWTRVATIRDVTIWRWDGESPGPGK
jgi:hypothetical protein